MSAHAFSLPERDAVYRAIRERRDMRHFRPGPIDPEVRQRLLAARAEGLGWVSLFDPRAVAQLLAIPPGGQPVAILCLGHVDAFYDAPMLESEGWDRRRALADCLFENRRGAR